MTTVASQITSLMVVYSAVIRAQIKENIKAPRHWHLCGEFTGTGEFPAQMVSNAENVSVWWRHHDIYVCVCVCINVCIVVPAVKPSYKLLRNIVHPTLSNRNQIS